MLAINTNADLRLLDQAHVALTQSDDIHPTMDRLFYGLDEARRSLPTAEWKEFATQCVDHPLKNILHQDPFTERAFAKPRGYAGDAYLMDYIYRNPSTAVDVDNSPKLGQEIYKYTSDAPSSRAVRCRRNVAAGMIDQLVDETNDPRILSIACGHMDEVKYSESLKKGKVFQFVGVDQDMESVQCAQQRYSHLPSVDCIQGDIKELIYGKMELGNFDFVYSLGLFDYLPRAAGQMLTDTMFDMLNPGGRLLIANFAHDNRDIGYIESFMDWQLIYRDEEEMIELAANVVSSADRQIFYEENQNVIFLEICKT